jgi:hypothetical protein
VSRFTPKPPELICFEVISSCCIQTVIDKHFRHSRSLAAFSQSLVAACVFWSQLASPSSPHAKRGQNISTAFQNGKKASAITTRTYTVNDQIGRSNALVIRCYRSQVYSMVEHDQRLLQSIAPRLNCSQDRSGDSYASLPFIVPLLASPETPPNPLKFDRVPNLQTCIF